MHTFLVSLLESWPTLAVIYGIDYLIIALYVWINYLDIRTTLRNVALGHDVEQNAKMKPYVIVGHPWLMAYGKLRVDYFMPALALIFPPFAAFLIRSGIGTYKAVRGNEKLANSQHIPGNA